VKKSESPNRTLILGRSLLAGAAGLLPVPYLDDLLAGAVRAALIRRLAEIRSIDLDANAVETLTWPRGSRVLQAATFGSAALGQSRRLFRRVATSLLVVRRADEALQTFQIGTLFDHYCARHHTGFGLDGKRAQSLRTAMDAAISRARSEQFERAFKNSLRLVARVPRRAAELLGRDRNRPIEPEIVEALPGETGYVASLCRAFDAALEKRE
jgi:uncharacterized protein (DUF697 family)